MHLFAWLGFVYVAAALQDHSLLSIKVDCCNKVGSLIAGYYANRLQVKNLENVGIINSHDGTFDDFSISDIWSFPISSKTKDLALNLKRVKLRDLVKNRLISADEKVLCNEEASICSSLESLSVERQLSLCDPVLIAVTGKPLSFEILFEGMKTCEEVSYKDSVSSDTSGIKKDMEFVLQKVEAVEKKFNHLETLMKSKEIHENVVEASFIKNITKVEEDLSHRIDGLLQVIKNNQKMERNIHRNETRHQLQEMIEYMRHEINGGKKNENIQPANTPTKSTDFHCSEARINENKIKLIDKAMSQIEVSKDTSTKKTEIKKEIPSEKNEESIIIDLVKAYLKSMDNCTL